MKYSTIKCPKRRRRGTVSSLIKVKLTWGFRAYMTISSTTLKPIQRRSWRKLTGCIRVREPTIGSIKPQTMTKLSFQKSNLSLTNSKSNSWIKSHTLSLRSWSRSKLIGTCRRDWILLGALLGRGRMIAITITKSRIKTTSRLTSRRRGSLLVIWANRGLPLRTLTLLRSLWESLHLRYRHRGANLSMATF